MTTGIFVYFELYGHCFREFLWRHVRLEKEIYFVGAFERYMGDRNLGVAHFAGRLQFFSKKMEVSQSRVVSMYSCKDDIATTGNFAECVSWSYICFEVFNFIFGGDLVPVLLKRAACCGFDVRFQICEWDWDILYG